MDTHQNDQHPKSEPTLQDMADIMDLDLDDQDPVTNHYDSTEFDPETDFADGQVIDVESIDGDDQFVDEFNPEKNRTIIGLSSNGIAKAAVIFGGTCAILGGGALFFQSQMPKDQVATAPEKKDPAKDKVDTAQTAAVKAQQSESEMKAELALSKQRDSLNAPSSTQPSTGSKTDESKPNSGTTPATTTKPVTVASPTVTTTAAKPSAINNKSSVAAIPIVKSPKANTPTQNAAVAKAPSQSTTVAAKPSISNVAKATPATQSMPIVKAPATQVAAAPANRANQSGTFTPVSRQPSESPLARVAKSSSAPGARAQKPTYTEPETVAVVPTETGVMSNDSNDSGRRLSTVKAPGVVKEEQLPAGVATNGDNAPPPALEPNKGMEVASELPSVTQYMKKAVDPNPATIVASTAPTTIATTATPAPVTIATNTAPAPVLASIATSPKETPARSGLQVVAAPGTNMPISVATVATPQQPTLVSLLANSAAGENSKNNQRTLIASTPNAANGLLAGTEVASLPKTGSKDKAQVMTNDGQSTVVSSPGLLLAGSLLTGTSAKGSTLMPILWGGDGTSNAKFVLKLDEPLLASNRREALPAGTQLIVMAKPTANSMGVADIEVVSIVVAGQEYAAPAGAFVVRDDQNGLLVGEDYYKRDEQIAGRDTMTFVTGALGTVGRVMNQPTSTFSNVNSGSFGNNSTNVTTNGSPNIVGAVLEGGFRDLPTIWSQRNQQALTELAGKPKIYQIAKGRSVRIFVNKPINF
jgi:hypothetical protein